MDIIAKKEQREHEITSRTAGFFNGFKVGEILHKSNAYKEKGTPVVQVMIYLVSLAFTNRSMYMNIINGTNSAGFGKDTVYRFLKSTFVNWSTYMLTLAMRVIIPLRETTSSERVCAIVIDDTMYARARSKTVELLANVCDHAEKGKSRFKRGFRMLTMGWTDGATFCPLLFRHMSSKDKKNRYTEINPNISKSSVGYKTRQQAITTVPEVMLWMLREAKKFKVPAKHVLFDSWFSFPSTMIAIKKLGFFTVGRLKNTTKIKYLVNGEKKTLKEIYESNKKRCGRAKYLLSVEVLLYNDKKETLPAKIVYVRERGKRNKWIAFASTDMSLSEEAIIALYGKRWDIEVFFKICKSHLNLAKEFQCLSYDSITAHTAVVMTRYMMLALDKRHSEDPRSLSQVFWHCCDEAADSSFAKTLAILLDALHDFLHDNICLSDVVVTKMIDIFFDKVAICFKRDFRQINLLRHFA
jgi:hypothetical protein